MAGKLVRVYHCLFAVTSRDVFTLGLYVEVVGGKDLIIDGEGKVHDAEDIWIRRDLAYNGVMMFNRAQPE